MTIRGDTVFCRFHNYQTDLRNALKFSKTVCSANLIAIYYAGHIYAQAK